MQTFLAYPDFIRSAKCLDMKRLGKQRVEALQIVEALLFVKAYRNHTASVMWREHTNALVEYGVAICKEWRSRGYKDTVLPQLEALWQKDRTQAMPPWFGSRRVHSSHRSRLIWKDRQFYEQYKWPEPFSMAYYFWPKPEYDWRRDPDDRLDQYANADVFKSHFTGLVLYGPDTLLSPVYVPDQAAPRSPDAADGSRLRV